MSSTLVALVTPEKYYGGQMTKDTHTLRINMCVINVG